MQKQILILLLAILAVASLAVLEFVRAKLLANERTAIGEYYRLRQTYAEVSASNQPPEPVPIRPASHRREPLD